MFPLTQFVFPFQEQFHLWVAFKQRWDRFLRPDTWRQAFCYSLLWNLTVSGVQLHQWDTFKLTTLINGPGTFTKSLPSNITAILEEQCQPLHPNTKWTQENGATPGKILAAFTNKRHGLIVGELLLKRMLIMSDTYF